MNNFDFKQNISSVLALSFLLLLSFITAWYSVTKGQEIVDNAKNSQTFNIQLEDSSPKAEKIKR